MPVSPEHIRTLSRTLHNASSDTATVAAALDAIASVPYSPHPCPEDGCRFVGHHSHHPSGYARPADHEPGSFSCRKGLYGCVDTAEVPSNEPDTPELEPCPEPGCEAEGHHWHDADGDGDVTVIRCPMRTPGGWCQESPRCYTTASQPGGEAPSPERRPVTLPVCGWDGCEEGQDHFHRLDDGYAIPWLVGHVHWDGCLDPGDPDYSGCYAPKPATTADLHTIDCRGIDPSEVQRLVDALSIYDAMQDGIAEGKGQER